MGRAGLKSIHMRRKQRSLADDRKARGEGYPNLIRVFHIKRPFQVLSGDIGSIRMKEGFTSLCRLYAG